MIPLLALVLAVLPLLPVRVAAEAAGETTSPALSDLAKKAATENLPQVSAAVLRSRIQQEQDPSRRMELTRRLIALLVSVGRFEEALAVGTGVDPGKDPQFAYWKGVALLGSGDDAAAAGIFGALVTSHAAIPGISRDQLLLALARAQRGGGDPKLALDTLETIPSESSVIGEVIPERVTDMLLLGRTEEALALIQGWTPSSAEEKAAHAYINALAAWRSGNAPAAGKLFAAVPSGSVWYGQAATIGAALCLSSSGKQQSAIELLEKHLDASDSPVLLDEQFLVLGQLCASAGMRDSGMLKKWSEDASNPARARLAMFHLAKTELRLGHPEKAEALLTAFINAHPGDSLADNALVLLSSSKLQAGKAAEALSLASDRPVAPKPQRARLAYIRGLSFAFLGKKEEAKAAFDEASGFDPSLASNALFNKAVLVAMADNGSLDISGAAKEIIARDDGLPSLEMKYQTAIDLLRRGNLAGLEILGQVAEQSDDPSMKSQARLASAEWNMNSGKGDAANRDLSKAVRENSGEPEREEYLQVFLKDGGRKSDLPAVIKASRDFLKAHPDSHFVPEVRLKLAEALLSSGDVQAARVEFEQLAFAGMETDLGRRALFLAAQSAARAMDPASIDDSLMLLERVAETGGNDQLVWQARLQQGALKNAQNLPSEALAIYDKIISSPAPDAELRAAALMAKGDTLHQLGAKDPASEREAVRIWRLIGDDEALPLRWRNQALCKSGVALEKLGEGDAALAAYYQAFKAPRLSEPEQLWHDKAAFEAARLLEARKQWGDAVTLYGQIAAEGGPRADEAKARLAKLKLENFLWEN